MKYYLGIDLGGTNIATGVVDEKYRIVEKYSTPTLHRRSFEDVVKDIVKAGQTVLEKAGLSQSDIEYVGVGVPSTIDQSTQRVIYANNLDWHNKDFVGEFQKKWDIPVLVANDADVAVCAEVLAGAGVPYDNILMLTLGTGVGGGIVFKKELFTGGDGYGNEAGHTILVAGGEPCTCGRKGCFEAYGSVTALIRDTIRAMADYPQSKMRELCGGDISRVNGRTAFDAAKLGDKAGELVVDQYITYLAEGISSLVILLRPEAVLLGGGICNEGDTLFIPLREKVDGLVYGSDLIGTPPILKAELGNDAGIIGAALLGIDT